MFSNPVIKTANAITMREGKVLTSPSKREREGAKNSISMKSNSETTKTSMSEANVTAFALFLSPLAMYSETSFIEATGRPEATIEQQTE